MRGFTTLKIITGLFLIIAIIVAVYFFTADRAKAPVQEENLENINSTTTTTFSGDLPQGVSVIEEGGKRILRDERVGYEMEIPEDLRLKREENTILFYSKEPNFPVLGGIDIHENSGNLSLDDWVANFNKEAFFTFYNQREKVKFGKIEAIKIPVEGEMEYYDYFFKQKDKIIDVTLVGENYSGQYLESIRIFN